MKKIHQHFGFRIKFIPLCKLQQHGQGHLQKSPCPSVACAITQSWTSGSPAEKPKKYFKTNITTNCNNLHIYLILHQTNKTQTDFKIQILTDSANSGIGSGYTYLLGGMEALRGFMVLSIQVGSLKDRAWDWRRRMKRGEAELGRW